MPVVHTDCPDLLPPQLAGRAADDHRPLLGLTVLLVEDSRFACDAMRLLCQRSGARLRRAETLHAARSHLKVYRPDVVIVDLGLPDGRGESLIRSLALQIPRPSVILGSSGDPAGRTAALAAGAAGFLEKPIASLAAFQAALLHYLPEPAARLATAPATDPPLAALPPADPLALHDDLARAAELIAATPDPSQRRYLTGFLAGLARSTHDRALAQAAALADGDSDTGFAALAGLLARRLAQRTDLFAPSSG